VLLKDCFSLNLFLHNMGLYYITMITLTCQMLCIYNILICAYVLVNLYIINNI